MERKTVFLDANILYSWNLTHLFMFFWNPKDVISFEDTHSIISFIYFCSKCKKEDIDIIFSYEYKGKIINLKSMFEYLESDFNLKKIAYTKECDIDLTKEHIHTKILNRLKEI